MDDSDQVFSHQVQAVRKLALKFDRITVITARLGEVELPPNVKVFETRWKPGSRFISILGFLRIFFLIITKERNLTIFSHMTEVQSSLVAPLTKIFRIPHYLWYAHTSHSCFLKWSHYWLTGVITSTPGSSPISGKKIFPIGQAIDPSQFSEKTTLAPERKKFIHIGRFDASKGIPKIIEVISELRQSDSQITLTLIGSPSSPENARTADLVISSNKKHVDEGWLTFLSSVKRAELPEVLRNSDVFIHAFQGSLDKTLVEATMVGIPVVTVNSEYLKEFGSWSGRLSNQRLKDQLDSFMEIPAIELVEIVRSRRLITLERHSLDAWIKKLCKILKK